MAVPGVIPTPHAVSNHPRGVEGGSVFARNLRTRLGEKAVIHPRGTGRRSSRARTPTPPRGCPRRRYRSGTPRACTSPTPASRTSTGGRRRACTRARTSPGPRTPPAPRPSDTRCRRRRSSRRDRSCSPAAKAPTDAPLQLAVGRVLADRGGRGDRAPVDPGHVQRAVGSPRRICERRPPLPVQCSGIASAAGSHCDDEQTDGDQ